MPELPQAAYTLADLPDGWRVGQFAQLIDAGIVHAVTTIDSITAPPTPEATASAAATIAQHLGMSGVAYCQQVHGGDVLHAADPGLAGEGDGLVCNTSGLGVMGISADCPLVLLADRSGRAVAVAHASWRGTVRKVAAEAVRQMVELGCKREELIACIAPSAGPCCYEVGPDVRDAAIAWLGRSAERFFVATDVAKWHFNLWAANADQLEQAGVPESAIDIAGVCTICCGGLYPSYRREAAAANRFYAVIAPK